MNIFKKIIKNIKGSGLVEKIMVTAFAVAAGGAVIAYTRNVIIEHKAVSPEIANSILDGTNGNNANGNNGEQQVGTTFIGKYSGTDRGRGTSLVYIHFNTVPPEYHEWGDTDINLSDGEQKVVPNVERIYSSELYGGRLEVNDGTTTNYYDANDFMTTPLILTSPNTTTITVVYYYLSPALPH